MEEAANTDLSPPLTIEGDHLRAGLGTGSVAVVVEPREGGRWRVRQLLPEAFDGFMIELVARFVIKNPTQFSIVKAPVQAFEALQFLNDRFGYLTPAPPCAYFDVRGEEAQHSLLLKASFELADRVGMEMRVGRPLCGGAFLQQDRANDLIASLNRIAKAQLQLVEVRQLFHGRVLPCEYLGPA